MNTDPGDTPCIKAFKYCPIIPSWFVRWKAALSVGYEQHCIDRGDADLEYSCLRSGSLVSENLDRGAVEFKEETGNGGREYEAPLITTKPVSLSEELRAWEVRGSASVDTKHAGEPVKKSCEWHA